ncbi:MAG: hypothetical protein ABL886_11535 [Rhodoglobus sp.]
MSFPQRSARVLVSVAAATLLLAACAPPQPEPTDAAPSESSSPVAAAPSFRLGLTCADLFDVATVQAQLSEPVTVKTDETSVLSEWDDVNFAQQGGLHCAWGGATGTDQFSDVGYELWIRPDAQADFDTWLASGQATLDAQCFESGFPCHQAYTFEGNWVRTYMSDSGVSVDDAAITYAALNNVIDEKIAGLPLADPWPAPASGGDLCAEPAATERASQALQRDQETLVGPQFPPDLSITTTGGTAITCGYYDYETFAQYLTVRQVQGGGWAFAAMATEAPEPFLIEPMVATPIEGADVAYIGCGDGCAALLKIGDDLVQLNTGEYFDREGFLPVVTAWVAGI